MRRIASLPSALLMPAVPTAISEVSDSSQPGSLTHWINLEAIQLITHHTTSVIASVILFWFVGWLIRRLLHDGVAKRIVLLLDEVVLICIFAYFAYELLFFLYLRTRGVWPS